MSQIHILDKSNFEIKEVLSNKAENKVVLQDTHKRNIETYSETYDFILDYRASEGLENRDRVLIPDEIKGYYREFIINKIDTDTADGETEVFSEASYFEDLQKAKPIAPQTLTQATPQSAVEFALTGTGWQLGEVEYAGFRTISWTSYNTPFEVLKILTNRFEAQLDFSIETRGNKVTKRLVHLRQPKDLFGGKEIRRGKDLEDLQRSTLSTDVVTALVAIAPEPQEEDGVTPERLIIEVKDDEAQAKWGKTYNYLWGIYEPESNDGEMTEARLRTLATTELNKHNKPKVEYSISAVSIEEQFPHERVLIGDKIRLKDDLSEPYFYVDATIKEVTRSVFDKHSKSYVLGEITEHDRIDLRKHFQNMLGELRERLKNTNSNLDNIVTIIDTEVERRIHRGDTPPENPINGQLWMDTTDRDRVIIKEYFNGEWIERVTNVHDAEDIGAITREQAMYEAVLSAFENFKVVHSQLMVEALAVKDSKYINQTHIDNINAKLQQVISTYELIRDELAAHEDDARITLEISNYLHQLMLDYSSAVSSLRTALQEANEFAMAHLAYLQSQYTDEKYDEALSTVADKFGLTYEDGILLGNTVLMSDLESTKESLEQQLKEANTTLTDMIDNITGDSRNMIIGTSLMDDSQFNLHGGSIIPDSETIEYVHFDSNGISDNLPHIKFHNTNTYNAGDTYTLALDFRSDTVTELDYICLCTDTEHNILHTDMQPQPFNLTSDGQWHRHFMQFTPETNLVNAYVKIGTDFSNSDAGEFDIRRIHIYKGTSELTWLPAPEDNRQFITQLSREITEMEHKLASKLTREDYDVLAGDISSLNTEIIQTAESITQKADKSYVDTVNETVTNHSTQLTTHAEGINSLITKTDTQDGKLTTVTNTANQTAEGLEQTIAKVTKAEGAITQAQADIIANTTEISNKLSSAEYKLDQENIVQQLNMADSERTQLAFEIQDRVTLADYKIDKDANAGALNTLATSITQNGKDIALRATKEALDGVDKTLKASHAELKLAHDNITTDVAGLSDNLTEVSTTVTQNKDAFDVSIKENTTKFSQIDDNLIEKVGKSEIVTSINASTEGVKIKGDLVEITAGSQINLAIQGAKDYADDIASNAEQSAKDYALAELNKAKTEDLVQKNKVITEINLDESGAQIKGDRIELTAGSAIKLAIDSAVEHADAEILEAKKYADKVSKEAEEAASAYAKTKAESERLIAEAHADGKVTAEEQARINDVKAKLDLAKTHADTQAKAAQDAATAVANSKVAPSEVIPSINLDKTGAQIDGNKIALSAGSAIKLAIDATEKKAIDHSQKLVDDLVIGGTNLIPKTDFEEYINPPIGWSTWGTGTTINNRIQHSNYILAQNNSLTSSIGITSDRLTEQIIEGQTYTLSFIAITSAHVNSAMNYTYLMNDGNGVNYSFPTPEREFVGNVGNMAAYKYTTTRVAPFGGQAHVLIGSDSITQGAYGYIYMSKPQLEIGNKATAWSKAHRDSVSKERIIAEINLDKSGTKISGDMVDINANRINLGANESFKLLVGDTEQALKDAKKAQDTASAAVPKTGVVTAINASRESMKISADKLELIGGKSISIRLNDADKAASNAQSTANTANKKANDVGDELNNLDAAGTNMLQHTNFSDLRNIKKMGAPWGSNSSYSRSKEYILVTTSNSGSQLGMRTMDNELYFEPNTKYTLSFKAYSSGYTTGDFNYVYIYRPDGSNEGSFATKRVKLGDAPQKGYTLYEYRVTFTSTKDHDKPAQMLIADTTTRTGVSTWVRIKDIMLQKGNLATPYALHPSEVVEKRNIIPEINLNDQGAKIQGNKIKLVAGDEISLEIADTKKKIIGAHVPNRNLIQNGDLWNSSKRFFDTHTSTATDIFGTIDNPPIGKGWVRMQRSDGNLSYMWTHNGGKNRFTVTAGKTYTFSILVTQNYHGNDLNYVWIRRVADNRQINLTNHLVSKTLIGEQWGRPVYRYVYTFDVPWTSNEDTVMFMGMNNTTENSRGYYLSEWKLEEGSEATAYDEELASKQDLISQINLDSSGVKIQGENVDIVGNATFKTTQGYALNGSAAYNRTVAYDKGTRAINPNVMKNWGMTTISGGNIQTDQMTAKRVIIERSDARTVGGKRIGVYMNDGKPNSSYDLTRNHWLQGGNAIEWNKQGYMLSSTNMTSNTYYSAETIYTVHHARYMTVTIGYNYTGDTASVYALGQIYSFNGGKGNVSSRTFIRNDGDTYWENIRIDLGVPDFSTSLAFYLRFGLSTTAPGNNLKVRINRVHMHG